MFAVLRLFGSLDNADVYTVASHTKFIINYIFHGVGLLKLAEVDSCIAESQIREIVFLRGFDIRLSLDVITLSRFDQERVLKAVQIFLDGFRGDFGFLNGLEGIAQLFGIGQRTDRRGKDIQKIFQFTDISDFIALANITDINLAEKILQSRSFVTGIISQNHKRDTAVKHIFRQAHVFVAVINGHELGKAQRVHMDFVATTGELSSYIFRQKFCVASGYKNIHVFLAEITVQHSFKTIQHLDFVQQEVIHLVVSNLGADICHEFFRINPTLFFLNLN